MAGSLVTACIASTDCQRAGIPFCIPAYSRMLLVMRLSYRQGMTVSPSIVTLLTRRRKVNRSRMASSLACLEAFCVAGLGHRASEGGTVVQDAGNAMEEGSAAPFHAQESRAVENGTMGREAQKASGHESAAQDAEEVRG
jgi:hypothetical protein